MPVAAWGCAKCLSGGVLKDACGNGSVREGPWCSGIVCLWGRFVLLRACGGMYVTEGQWGCLLLNACGRSCVQNAQGQ